MLSLGIDPGGNGALALYDASTEALEVWDMPTNAVTVGGKKRARVDMSGLGDLFDYYKIMGVQRIVIEQVGGMPGQASGFAFGFSVGLLHMGLRDRLMAFDVVTPAQWKKAVKAPKDKKEAVVRAGELFPQHVAKFRSTEKSARGVLRPDRAEAALLAYWGATHRGA